MTDIFEAPRKPGFGVGVSIIVTDGNGNKISTEHYEALGFDNALADYIRKEIKDAVEELVDKWRDMKARGELPELPGKGRG